MKYEDSIQRKRKHLILRHFPTTPGQQNIPTLPLVKNSDVSEKVKETNMSKYLIKDKEGGEREGAIKTTTPTTDG